MNISVPAFDRVLETVLLLRDQNGQFQIRELVRLPDEDQREALRDRLSPLFTDFVSSMEAYYDSIDHLSCQKYKITKNNFLKSVGGSADENSFEPWIIPIMRNKINEAERNKPQRVPLVVELRFIAMCNLLNSEGVSHEEFKPLCRDLMTSYVQFWESEMVDRANLV
jgi:hypothetical protein